METRRPQGRGGMSYALIYHDVAPPEQRESVGFPGPLAARYKLDPGVFERHLEAIAATGTSVGLMTATPAPTAVITFDDGGASALLAAEMLDRHGFKGHFFIATGRIGTPGFLDAAGVGELAARGHGVGSHSHTHPTYMGRLDHEEILEEWNRSREVLAELLGTPPVTASVPGGFLSRNVIFAAAEAGFELLMTSEPVARLRRHDGLTVAGRYTIWSTTPAGTAAAYARGATFPRARLWLEWNAKKQAKRVSPKVYQTLRRLRASRS
jgi:peptidoglycan/xylan/chitin deacetylase (PgdA/CDA1 family)